jgi:Terpene synthase family 2, C-terminal metal binding
MPRLVDPAAVDETARRAVERLRHEPVQLHFSSDLAEAATQLWARRHGLVDADGAAERLQRIRCGSFAAHTYPRASVELVELGANLIAWLFLFDDKHGESSDLREMIRAFERCEAVLRDGAVTEGGAFERALADLRARALKLGGDAGWLGRFSESMGRYFNGCVLEYPYRLQNLPPTLATYRQLRCWSIGAYPVFDLIELSEGEPTPPARFRLGELRYLGALLCSWVNDIHSHRKEEVAQDPLNLVTVLERERGLALEEAYEAAVDVYHVDLDRFNAAAEALVAAKDATAADHNIARALSEWVHGNCVWTRTSGRYRRHPPQEMKISFR